MLAEKLQMAASGSQTAFDPLSMGWAHWWSADSISASDGATTFNWGDEITTNNLANLSGTQTYRASASTLNNKPAVEFASSGIRRRTGSTISTARSMVYISDYTAAHAIRFRNAPYNDWDPSIPRLNLWATNDHRHDKLWDTAIGPKVWIFVYLGGTSGTKATMNGLPVSTISGSNMTTWTNRDLGAENGTSHITRFGLYAEYAGDITTHADYTKFLAWCATEYGVDIWPGAQTPDQVSGLGGWWDAGAITGYTDGQQITTAWQDGSASNFDLTPTLVSTHTTYPTYETNEVNGLPAVQLTYTAEGQYTYFAGPTVSGTFTSAVHGFVVAKANNSDPPGDGISNGLWRLGAWPTTAQHIPWTDGNVYDGFGSTTRRNCGNPSTSTASWFLYEIVSTSSEWTNFFNGNQLYTTGTNTFDNDPTFDLGRGGGDVLYNWGGWIAECALFTGKLSNADRASIRQYFATKYGLTVNIH